MRLTNPIREAFVKAVMDDVPRIDYREQAQTIIRRALLKAAPKVIQEGIAKHPEYFNTHYVSYSSLGGMQCYGVTGSLYNDSAVAALTDIVNLDEIDALIKKAEAQEEQRNDLEAKLRGVAFACTTRKALVDALPEFEKYLPTESSKGTNLPALANVVADFMQAGWPKEKAA